MPREEFDRGLQLLEDDLLNLSSMVEKSILRSIDALKNRDLKLAEEIIFQDNYIDEKTTQIEEKCIHLIATQQPIATDLRKIVVFLLISNELERIGDYAEGIAKISICLLLLRYYITKRPNKDYPKTSFISMQPCLVASTIKTHKVINGSRDDYEQ